MILTAVMAFSSAVQCAADLKPCNPGLKVGDRLALETVAELYNRDSGPPCGDALGLPTGTRIVATIVGTRAVKTDLCEGLRADLEIPGFSFGMPQNVGDNPYVGSAAEYTRNGCHGSLTLSLFLNPATLTPPVVSNGTDPPPALAVVDFGIDGPAPDGSGESCVPTSTCQMQFAVSVTSL